MQPPAQVASVYSGLPHGDPHIHTLPPPILQVVINVTHAGKAVAPGPVPTTIDTAAVALKQALTGNAFYVDMVVQKEGMGLQFTMAEFKPTVVQLYTDNIDQIAGLTSLVAADLFATVLALPGTYQVYPTSAQCTTKSCLRAPFVPQSK